MKYKIFKLGSLLLLSIGILSTQAQETFSASGGDASGSGGSSSYTLGQVVYTTIEGSGSSLAQGVQQAFEISVTTGVNENLGIDLEYMAYPNPTSAFLTLKVENKNLNEWHYQLIDSKGLLIENKKVVEKETTINMQSLVPAIYFLIILDQQEAVKTFKIIKN